MDITSIGDDRVKVGACCKLKQHKQSAYGNYTMLHKIFKIRQAVQYEMGHCI